MPSIIFCLASKTHTIVPVQTATSSHQPVLFQRPSHATPSPENPSETTGVSSREPSQTHTYVRFADVCEYFCLTIGMKQTTTMGQYVLNIPPINICEHTLECFHCFHEDFTYMGLAITGDLPSTKAYGKHGSSVVIRAQGNGVGPTGLRTHLIFPISDHYNVFFISHTMLLYPLLKYP